MNPWRSFAYRAQRLIYGPLDDNAPPAPQTYTYLDPLDLPPIDRATLLGGQQTGVWYESDNRQRYLVRYAPTFLDDPDNTGLFGVHDTDTSTLIHPPVVAMSGRDVDLIGYREYLTQDHRFFTDDPLFSDRRSNWLRHLKRPEWEMNENTRFQGTVYADTFTLSRDLGASERIDDRVVALGSQEPFNYGSWLFRTLTKIAGLEALDLMDEQILVHMRHPSFRESLELAGVNPKRLIDHDVTKTYRLRHAVIPGLRNGHALLDDASRAVFARLREGVGYNHDKRMLYVARHTPGKEAVWNGRVLLNEAELITRLKGMGFQIVLPGALSMAEQIRTFAAAGLVVGGSGSALFNAVFCRPGTKLIDIESERDWINAHVCLFSSAQLDYGIFVGVTDPTDTAPVHKRWRVNIDALVDRIRSFTAG